MSPGETNFAQLEAAGLIVKGFKFSEADKRAIESLHPDEVRAIIKIAHKLAPHGVTEGRSPLRGIIL